MFILVDANHTKGSKNIIRQLILYLFVLRFPPSGLARLLILIANFYFSSS